MPKYLWPHSKSVLSINVFEISDVNDYAKEAREVFPNSVFITPDWLECFRSSFRLPIYLRFVSAGRTVGIIAGLRLKSSNRLLRNFYRPIFFFSGPSVIGTAPDLVSICLRALIEFAQCHGYSRILLSSWDYPQLFDSQILPIRTSIRKEYIIDLREDLQNIKKKVRPYIKRNSRRAVKHGVTFHESNSADLIAKLLFLLEETKKVRLTRGHADYTYYYMPFIEDKIIYKMVQRRIAKIYYALKNSNVVSAEFVITHSKRAYAMLNATSLEGYKIGANAFLKLKLIEKMKENGFEYLNLGGAPGNASGSSLAFYKLSCGAQDLICMGGTTRFLDGFIANFNFILNAYERINREKIKRILGRRITRKIKYMKENLHW